MKQIYIESYYRNGYSRFTKYINNVFSHPKRETIEKRLAIIEFFNEFSRRLLGKLLGKAVPMFISRNSS